MEKIRILCYGDSNTWGAKPENKNSRYGEGERYTSILQNMLGEDYLVLNEGLCSRTLDSDDIKLPKGNRNGLLFFAPCVMTHDPIDYLVLFLGSNELKEKFNKSAEDIAHTLQEKYIKFLQNDLSKELLKQPKIILIAPGVISKDCFLNTGGAYEKSLKFNDSYKKVAENTGCYFVDNRGILPGEDGLHLAITSHKYIANELYKIITCDKKEKLWNILLFLIYTVHSITLKF